MKKITFFLCALLISAMSFAETYSHTFNSGELKTGTVTLSDVSWATTMKGSTYYGWDSNTSKGIQIGKSKEACTSYSLTTSHFADYMVTNITVNASTASSGTAKMQVSVGGVDYIAQTALTTSATDYTGAGSSSGDVVISFTNTAKAFYIKSISITYQAVSADEGMILVDQFNVDFGKVTKTKTIVVTGQNLTSAITTSLKEGANFTVTGNLTAEGGELTVNYIATEAGKHTDVLVLTSDDVTTEVALAGEVVVLEGAGTKENPYTVADVIALGLTDKTQAWVEGYIIGTMKDNALEETPSQYSNIVLAAAADVKENYVPVALASGTNPRAALNVVDNPTMLGAKVAVYGTLETYFSKPGVKNVSDYEILSTVTPEPVMFTVTATAENGTVEGAGEYAEGTEITLIATANEGYEFVNWTENEVEVSTDAEYTFEVLADRALVANFREVVVEPTTETVYFIDVKKWGKVNAYAWTTDPIVAWPGAAATKEAEQIAGYDVYSFTANAGQYANVIFNDGSSQTDDLVWTAGKYYVIDGWYTKEEAEAKLAAPIADIWTVAGAPASIFGTEWDPSNAANDLVKQEDGTYKWEKTDLTLSASNIQFKVVKNHAWGEEYPGSNYTLSIAEAGIYTITITFNADTKEVAGTATKTGSAVVIPTIAIAGDMNGWNTTANEFVVAADELTASLTLPLEAQDYGFKIIVAGGWTSNAATITRENNTAEFTENGDNSTLTADVAGEYTFTWTYATKTLTVTYPELPEVIEYVLNGGVLPLVGPTNAELWEMFKPYYNTYYGLTRADQPIDKVSTFAAAKMQEIMTDEASEYKWLGDYVQSVATAAGVPLSTDMAAANEGGWRWAVHAFFNANAGQFGATGIDFTEAGKPENWVNVYPDAQEVVLPNEPVEEDYVLPTPTKSGSTFKGWYDNAEGTGEAYTVIPAGWSGTLYAIWKQSPTTALENIAVEGKAVKAIVNGQLIIIKNGVQYNAQGAVVK